MEAGKVRTNVTNLAIIVVIRKIQVVSNGGCLGKSLDRRLDSGGPLVDEDGVLCVGKTSVLDEVLEVRVGASTPSDVVAVEVASGRVDALAGKSGKKSVVL